MAPGLNEVQSAGFDVGARTLSARPTSRSVSRWIEPAFLAGDDPDPFDLCYRREQREILGRALSSLRDASLTTTMNVYEKAMPNIKREANRKVVSMMLKKEKRQPNVAAA